MSSREITNPVMYNRLTGRSLRKPSRGSRPLAYLRQAALHSPHAGPAGEGVSAMSFLNTLKKALIEEDPEYSACGAGPARRASRSFRRARRAALAGSRRAAHGILSATTASAASTRCRFSGRRPNANVSGCRMGPAAAAPGSPAVSPLPPPPPVDYAPPPSPVVYAAPPAPPAAPPAASPTMARPVSPSIVSPAVPAGHSRSRSRREYGADQRHLSGNGRNLRAV